jgi:phospholipid/cholesterol/gamma-HCH transport system ATP-binding protein
MSAPSARASYLVAAYEMGVEGAQPLVFRSVDLRENPDHPDHRFELTVEHGTTVLCIGDEDSGVGDLGRWAMGLARPPAGQVLVYGSTIADLPYDKQLLFRRRLGYTQLGDGLLQNLTLRGNIVLPLAYASERRSKEVTDRASVLVEAFGLRDAEYTRPAQANEEDRRRAAVARAISLDPELVVLEAPFDGLTGRAARDILEQVRLRRDGSPRTVFITAQDTTPAVQPLITRTIRLLDGLATEGAH